MLIFLGIVAVIGFYLVTIYNRLVAMRQTVGQSWSDIDVQLKQRYDLIPNLVKTVKGYAKHEKDTLQAVVDARSSAMGAGNVTDQAAAENMLSGALKSLFALAEAYPDLKANTNFLQLQSELSDIENKIAAARRFFNNSVAEYNTGQEQFPAVLFSKQMGFDKRDFFEVAASERDAVASAPDISF
ncbi:LemA protein [hydrothermal vent metagenome]|uniref:LemA protein n=1 Tax=hydrothermal vent metagenome TaxID=652676 RepID=A0A3B0RFX9_9ZZZZ